MLGTANDSLVVVRRDGSVPSRGERDDSHPFSSEAAHRLPRPESTAPVVKGRCV